jgi:hypothetical protein
MTDLVVPGGSVLRTTCERRVVPRFPLATRVIIASLGRDAYQLTERLSKGGLIRGVQRDGSPIGRFRTAQSQGRLIASGNGTPRENQRDGLWNNLFSWNCARMDCDECQDNKTAPK